MPPENNDDEVLVLAASDDEKNTSEYDSNLEDGDLDPEDDDLENENIEDDEVKSEYADIINIEEIAAQESEAEPEQEEVKETKSNKKLFIFIGIGVLVFIIIIILLVLIFSKEKPKAPVEQIAKKIEKSYKPQKFEASQIDDMINTANQLYERGDKFKALEIYENIATFNQGLSNYNLGVSQMKQEKYADAISSFDKAIQDFENTSVSAINAAVCSRRLGDNEKFKYYIDLAESFLQDEGKSPLYNYYFALINYYKGNYIEALHALSQKDQKYYKDRYAYLSSKILTALGRDDEAIAKLESIKKFDTNIALAQLYAKKANFDKAREYLARATKNTTQTDFIKMTAAMIDLKTGYYGDAAGFIKEIYDVNSSLPFKFYKIKTKLNPEIFNVNLAQNRFHNDMFFDKTRRYEALFYFAPYKVFDAKHTMSQIRKGGISLFLDDTNGATSYLRNTLGVSKVDTKLSSAIALALNYELKNANLLFQQLAKEFPKHSILQYNLALSHAQLGNFTLAAKHFLSSYRLDQSNYLAAAFYVIASDIIDDLNPKFISEFRENMHGDTSLKEPNIYNAILALVDSNYASMIRYMEEGKDDTTLSMAFDIITAKVSGFNELMHEKTAKLLKVLPDDIVVNILHFIALNPDDSNMKDYAKQIQIYFKNKQLNLRSFYSGANIIKKQYIKLLQVAGLLNYERDKIRASLQNAPDSENMLQTLAYIELFTEDFDESFKIYNRLIDEFQSKDANTFFLASVAATGANKPNNAIALLELAKLGDPMAVENRVALGYLYHQTNNLEAALLQYNKVSNTKHKNEFYDFDLINTVR